MEVRIRVSQRTERYRLARQQFVARVYRDDSGDDSYFLHQTPPFLEKDDALASAQSWCKSKGYAYD